MRHLHDDDGMTSTFDDETIDEASPRKRSHLSATDRIYVHMTYMTGGSHPRICVTQHLTDTFPYLGFSSPVLCERCFAGGCVLTVADTTSEGTNWASIPSRWTTSSRLS